MKIWLIVLQAEDTTWVEGAWDDESTAENRSAWKMAVDVARKSAHKNGYELRIIPVVIEGIYKAFETKELTGEVESAS